MKIGICGGTFNPIHLGHTHIMTEFYKALNLDKLLVIPTKKPPHKEALQLASEKDRFKMCELAISELNGNFIVSDLEFKREGKSYTSHTIKEILKENLNAEIFLIVGEDMYFTLETWFEHDYIFKNATICVSPRSYDGLCKMKEYKNELLARYDYAKIEILDIEYLPISSTQIREEKYLNLVDKKVVDYIRDNNIY